MAKRKPAETKAPDPGPPPVGAVQSRNLLDGVHQLGGILARPDTEIRLDTYTRMADTDETVGTGLEFLALAAASRLGDYQNEEHPEAAEFVNRALEQMRGSWKIFVYQFLECAFTYGHAVAELVVDYRDGAFLPRELPVLNPESYVFELDLTGGPNHGQIERVRQWPLSQYEESIPRDKAVHLAHRSKFGNPYGKSRLRRCFKDWFIKDRTLQAWGLATERYGNPLAVVKAQNPEAEVAAPGGGKEKKATALLRLLEGLSNSSGLVVGNLEAVEFLQSARDIGGDFETLQNHMNRMILRALLVPALVLENTEVGSYALGTQHFNVFLLGLESILEEASEVLLEQFVRRLLTWNFGSRLKSWGSFVMQPLQPDDLKLFADLFATLTNAGYMTPELRADLNAVRKRFGLDPVESLPALPLPAEGEGEPPGEQPDTEGPEDLEVPGEAEDPDDPEDDPEEDPAERDRLLAQTTYFAERYHARRR